MPLQPSDSLLNGQYFIRALLGRGGFGFVYLADDTLLHEPVALKELIPALVGDEEILRRFLAEARATMRLNPVRIVRTHNVFAERGNYYIAMEYMAGGSLEARLEKSGAWPAEEAVRVAAEMCEGLAHAHAEGVVHCDLKPANVLFDAKGGAKVADFGIAHVPAEMRSRSWNTQAGFVAGTLPYMSPEQADGVRDDPRVDVYAVGAVLYRMLAGRPYLDFDQRETPGAQADNVYRLRSQAPVAPSTHNPRVPGWLDGVVLKALAKRREERYGSAAALREALLSRQGPPVAVPPARAQAAETVLIPPGAGSAPPLASQPGDRPPARAGAAPTEGSVQRREGEQARDRPSPHPAPSFWTGRRIAAIAGGVVAVVALTLWARSCATPPAVPQAVVKVVTPVVTQSATATPGLGIGSTMISEKDGMTLVYVPAGEFLMGSTGANMQASSGEKPQHKVTLDAYWIDRTEVMADQYAKCVAAGKCTKPRCTGTGEGDHPVVCVTWQDAANYCAWARRRLPTEAEWEKAARGPDGRKYPWGNKSPDCARANYYGCKGVTAAVGSYSAGASPYGALDMAGNVWEWVNDWYSSYFGSSSVSNPQGPATGTDRVLRGGGWSFQEDSLRSAYRRSERPASQHDTLGFRCAATPGKPPTTPETSMLAQAPTSEPPTPAPPPTREPPTSTPEPALGIGSMRISEKDGMTMVYVPAGEFLMGSTDGDPAASSDEKPQHKVTLEAFWIDRAEVTADQYAQCVAAGKCTQPGCTGAGKGDHPVVCVTREDAANYCAWAGRRLPTEAEWEKAARGTDGRKYPWGNEAPVCARANYWGKDGGCVGGTAAVGSYGAGASPYGALDMAGNVFEWVNDWYNSSYYGGPPVSNPQGPETGNDRVVRGCGWRNGGQYDLRVALRGFYPPALQSDDVGFRCAVAPGK
jgi:eukaryotic-like serine/threonine-protein kinase